uniref:site-specific integrase n=1 Tax=Novosphingobium acidiphilum TaxID=505248 RepID=UPI001B7FD1AE
RSVRGLWLRGSVYQFRVRVPADLAGVVGRNHVNRSLKTDSRSLAVRLSRKVSFEVESLFETLRRDTGRAFDERLLTVGAVPEKRLASSGTALVMMEEKPQIKTIPFKTLGDVYDLYLQDPTKKRSKRTMLAHYTTRKIVEDVMGRDTLITEITRENCREFLDILRWLPVNFSKTYRDMAVREVVELAKKDRKIRTINTTNINAYMARFATMLNWAVAEDHLGKNPAKALQLADTVRPQDRRKPFQLWQLQKIFSAPIYTGCKDEEQGYATAGTMIATGARFWIPLLGLFTGARLNELCQLDVADVKVIESVSCIVITEESASGERDKSLKTKASARIVPVHPTLLEIGFMAFVDRKRKSGSIKLFDDVPAGATGFRSVAFSRWFSRFLISSKANAPLTCFHSFRHGFRDAGRNAKIQRDLVLTLGGWITGGNQSEASDAYGSGYHPRVLFEAISAIEFPELDLSHLKPT